MPATTETPTAADLRALRARKQVDLYVLAARARIHPSRLGGYLRETLPLTREIAAKIAAALDEDGPSAA